MPVISVGASPASLGTLPDSTGVLIPGTALLESNMDTVDHHFNPFVEDVGYSMPSTTTGKTVNIGILPKDPGSPVD